MTPPSPYPTPSAAAIAAEIVSRADFNLPGVRERLLPPRFRVEIGTDTIFSYCARIGGGKTILLVGARQFSLLLQYARAAAAYLLPDEPGGGRPSGQWPGARSALATTVDWLASPTSAPAFPDPPLTPRQAEVAQAYAESAYRFGLCHEMAHVIMDDRDEVPTDAMHAGSDPLGRLRASQAQELQADRVGLMLYIRTRPPGGDLIFALFSALYFLHALALLDLRLMLLAGLVDAEAWEIEHTHPPSLLREASLMAAAEGLVPDVAAGLSAVHDDLSALDGEVRNAALEQQAEVLAGATSILTSQPTNPPAAAVAGLLQLLERSPTGVLLALEPGTSPAPAQVLDGFAAALPDSFQQFRAADLKERAGLA